MKHCLNYFLNKHPLKGIVHPKFSHRLLTLKLYQTGMSFYLLLNTIEESKDFRSTRYVVKI